MLSFAQRCELEALRGDLMWAQGARRPPSERAQAAIMAVFADRLLDGRLDYAAAHGWLTGVAQTIASWREGPLRHPDDATCCSARRELEREI